MCVIEETQIKDKSRSKQIEAYITIAKLMNSKNLWFFDTIALNHLTHNKNLLHNYKSFPQGLQVWFGNNGTKVAIGKEELHMSINQRRFQMSNMF